MRAKRWWPRVLWGLVLLVAVAAGAAALPRVARSYVVSQARARGVQLNPAHVRVGWLTVTLEEAELRLDAVDGVFATFPQIHLEVDGHLHPVAVLASGGRVTVANAETLPRQLALWREARPATASSSSGRAAFRVQVDIDTAVVDASEGRHLEATKVELLREDGRVTLQAATLDGRSGMVAVRSTDAHVDFDVNALAFREAHVATADVVWIEKIARPELSSPTPASPAPPPPAEVAPPSKGAAAAAAPSAPLPPLLPDLHDLRARIGVAIGAAAANVHDGSSVRIDALSARLQQGDEQLVLGTGALDVSRSASGIKVNFSTSSVGPGTPLALQADLPAGPGDIEISVSGGPVPLGMLGMREGGLLHLLDVEKTSVAGKGRIVLDSEGHTLTFDVDGSIRNLSLREPRLAHDPIRGMDLGLSTRGLMDDKGELRLDNAELSLGAARASVHGGLAQTADHLAATFDFDFPTSSCQSLLGSVPSALVPTVSTARMDGTFSLHGHLAVDTRNLDALAFNYDVSDRCRLVDVPAELDRGRFSHSFSHVIYTKTGEREEETTGPGTQSWTDLDNISPYMQVAVLTTEDGAFFHHHGFNHSAIRRAVAANIKAHRFVRGASTITMQLAKNLFLSREKTLARKLEELVLADYLEQAFTKDEMMELYLNIIEFGPNLYGVTAAADHYFGRKPNELNLAECMFLSSILPNPINFHKVYDDGQVGPGWMRTLQAHMHIAARTGLISPAELAEGLTEQVVFHKAGTPPPTPRPPISTPSHPASSTDWEELN